MTKNADLSALAREYGYTNAAHLYIDHDTTTATTPAETALANALAKYRATNQNDTAALKNALVGVENTLAVANWKKR